MTPVTSRPVLTVLCAPGGAAPPQIDRLSDRFEIRAVADDGLADALPGTDVLLLWDFFNPALRRAWPSADRLSWVHVAAAGVDAVMFDELRESPVAFTNARGVFDVPIAEYVLACVLAHAKLLHESATAQRAHEWRHREPRPVRGSTAVVVGTGGIGRATARLLRAVGMQVRGVGRRAREDDPDFGTVVASADLAAHVADADHLVNAAPLTPATTGLLDAQVLRALPQRAHVVNVGRGASLVEDDLVAALREGRLAGASLDVLAQEPPPADSPLWDVPGLRLSAHLSGDEVGWRDRLAEQFVDAAQTWLAGGELPNLVDKQAGYVPGGGA